MFLLTSTVLKNNFFKNSSRNTIRVLNHSGPDKDRHSVGPYLGPSCLQMLSADDKNWASPKDSGTHGIRVKAPF